MAVVRVCPGRSVVVRSRPSGRVIGQVGGRRQFGSPQTAAAAVARGRWLGAAFSVRTDGSLRWIDRRSSAVRVAVAPFSIEADLSRRRVELRPGDRVVKSVRVAIGRSGSPTPTGRFAITDKLQGTRFGPYYGCCILALSRDQPNLPPGWAGRQPPRDTWHRRARLDRYGELRRLPRPTTI